MQFKSSSQSEILNLFVPGEKLGATEISDLLGKSRVIVHKYLKELVGEKRIKKVGSGPTTRYLLVGKIPEGLRKTSDKKISSEATLDISFGDSKILNNCFYKFSPNGDLLEGYKGFISWCISRNLNIEEKLLKIISIYKFTESLEDECGLIRANKNFGINFEEIYLDSVHYADQYKRMEFGRGKLAEMTFYAKQSQNKKLIKKSITEIIFKLECHIKRNKYDAIAITPHSIYRNNQLLSLLKTDLQYLNIDFINLVKRSSSGINIPQKSLKSRKLRIENARNTIFVKAENIGKYKKVFLIDDFVGSGATLNETAKKLKAEGIEQVDGFAFVGNLDLSYDVINEI